jgi:hypothetical protein
MDAANTDELVQLAWEVRPAAHRGLLTQVGASQWEIVVEGLGDAAAARLLSASERPTSTADTVASNQALGMWVPNLRLVLINQAHPALQGADTATREALLMWVAWHEWSHALSVSSSSPHDPSEGEKLLGLAPDGIRERIRRGHYRRRQYIDELIAETYALLMRERIQGRPGQPVWLPNEIYQLITRIAP